MSVFLLYAELFFSPPVPGERYVYTVLLGLAALNAVLGISYISLTISSTIAASHMKRRQYQSKSLRILHYIKAS